MKNGPFDCSDVFHMGIDIHASGLWSWKPEGSPTFLSEEKSTHQVIQNDLFHPPPGGHLAIEKGH